VGGKWKWYDILKIESLKPKRYDHPALMLYHVSEERKKGKRKEKGKQTHSQQKVKKNPISMFFLSK
jgi:hypothetical protein